MRTTRSNHRRAFVDAWSGRAVDLHKGDLWRLENGLQDLSVMCTDGVLWLTQNGDHEDYVLEANQGYVISRRGEVVIQALSDARLRVWSPLELEAARSTQQPVLST